MKAFIKAISYYLPRKIINNSDLSKEFPNWTADNITSKVGIIERHIAAEDETATDMAIKSAEKLFVENNVNKSEIDFILFCTQSPDYFLPTSACIIQHKLGLSTTCGAIDFNMGCSGYIYGLSLAKGLIFSGVAKSVLLLTAETYSKHIHNKDRGNRTIFGDAACASLISTDGFAEIGEFILGTDGKGANNLIVKTGGKRNPKPINDLAFDDQDNPHSSDYLQMNGAAIFNFTADAVPDLIKNVLIKNKQKHDDIGLFIFHQANKYMINYLRKLINIEREKFFIYLEKVGNTVSSTIPIAIYEANKENKLYGNVLLAGFGVGYSWGGTILKCR